MKLYEIDSAIENAITEAYARHVDQDTGELLGELDWTEVDQLYDVRDQKIENIALYIKNTNAEIEALKTEVSKLQRRINAKNNLAVSLRDYLSSYMTSHECAKFETARVKVGFRKSVAVEIAPDAVLPDQYKRVITEELPEKNALKKALKAGEVISGVTLIERQNLQIG